jgi:hypothetical protein
MEICLVSLYPEKRLNAVSTKVISTVGGYNTLFPLPFGEAGWGL